MIAPSKSWLILTLVNLFSMALAACTPQIVEVEVTREVEVEVEVVSEIEVPVEVEVTREVEVEVMAEAEFVELFVGSNLDRYRLSGDGAGVGVSRVVQTNIGEPLLRIDPETYTIKPWLAESWETLDPLTWRINLRQGVLCHDGGEFTAEDAKWSIDKSLRWFPPFPGEVAVLDDYTLEITLARPFWYVAESLSHGNATVMYCPPSPDASTEDFPGTAPVATGPFMLDEYLQGESIRVVRFDDYWGGPAKADAITFRFIPDEAARILALQAGDIDILQELSRSGVPKVSAMSDVNLYVSNMVTIWSLYFATRNQVAPYDTLYNVQIRKAINYAIDRETIANVVLDGYAQPAVSLTPPLVNPDINANIVGYTYDPDRAVELLAAAGWTDSDGDGIVDKGGEPLSLTLVSGFPPADLARPIPEVIQSQLGDVGISLELVEFNDIGAYYDYITDGGETHMIIERGNFNTPDTTFYNFNVFCGCNADEEAILYERFWVNDEFDKALTDSQGSESNFEATAFAIDMNRLQVDEFTSVAPIVYLPNLMAAAANVSGITIHPSAPSQRWEDVTVSR